LSPRPFVPLSRTARIACLLAAMAAVAGCRAKQDPALAGPEYPVAKTQSRTLDIQVVRTETSLRLTNTTARAFGKSRLWINRWYSAEIPSFAVGQTIELRQDDFRDQYGEAFRGGGFFATRKPQKVDLVQLETEDGMVGLVAVGKED
jgi:hypothetical protein